MFELKKDTVYRHLRTEIISGRLRSGKLPRETELAKSLGVGKVTLRDSLSRLEGEGYIKRIHGKGTFVHHDGATTDTATIMVIRSSLSGFEQPWHYIVPAITRCAAENQMQTFITTTSAINMFSESDIKAFIKSNHVMGIVMVMNGFTGQESFLKKLKSAGVPAVIAHGVINDVKVTGLPCIVVSQREAWEGAIAYLCGLGHRRIAIVGYTESDFRGHSLTETLQLLKKYHALPDESLICKVDFNRENVIETVKNFCLKQERPTAILCFSDFYAIYVYDALKELNLNIPDDVAVMGICGYPDAPRLLNPPLSTIDYGYAKLAEMAVEMVQEPAKWSDPLTGKGKLRINPFKILTRKSTEPI